ncbi:hypothetical protein E2C01_072341 [Portunus trituberculatus]|uniref:Uncharacterized protein n=1 Tax=Portunus trituberculatus TaxID=210409 RepID=A0A5B7I2D6_PORTR|nr:hypothetical protein [Portunus trituberculatus]
MQADSPHWDTLT